MCGLWEYPWCHCQDTWSIRATKPLPQQLSATSLNWISFCCSKCDWSVSFARFWYTRDVTIAAWNWKVCECEFPSHWHCKHIKDTLCPFFFFNVAVLYRGTPSKDETDPPKYGFVLDFIQARTQFFVPFRVRQILTGLTRIIEEILLQTGELFLMLFIVNQSFTKCGQQQNICTLLFIISVPCLVFVWY